MNGGPPERDAGEPGDGPVEGAAGGLRRRVETKEDGRRLTLYATTDAGERLLPGNR